MTSLGGRETILVVEDSVPVLGVAQMVLETAGYRVLTATSAEQALEIGRAAGESIDLLFVDLVLPDGSGHELAQQLRAERPNLPVLYTSGYSRDLAPLIGVDAARTAFLQKPFRPASLLDRVRDLLDEAREL
jgi:DNA-binding response OmpR family regulator